MASKAVDEEKSILVQASSLLSRQKELRRLEKILEGMKKKEEESFNYVMNSEDKILKQWVTQLKDTRDVGQQSINNVCNFALKSVFGTKEQVRRTQKEIDRHDKEIQKE